MAEDQARLIDNMLIVMKAARDPEFADWNRSLIEPAFTAVQAATQAAIGRMVVLNKENPDVA